MAYYEQEYIEIKREKAKMEIVGVVRCSVELDDVRKYHRAQIARAKRRVVAFSGLIALAWLLAALLPLLELLSGRSQRMGTGTIILTAIFVLAAIFVTFIGIKRVIQPVRTFIAHADPESPEQQKSAAPAAVVWKQNKRWALCQAHDLVPLDSATEGHPVFLGSQRPSTDVERSLRRREEELLIRYALEYVARSAVVLIYLDIGKLGDGAYGHAAGEAVARVVPASALEGMRIFSGDSAATLAGAANEYAIALSGKADALKPVEDMLRADPALVGLLSASGIRVETATREPLAADGIVQGGGIVNPPMHGTSLCAAGFKNGWKA